MNYSYAISVGDVVHLKLVPELRTQVFHKLQRLSFRFFDENATGSIINRVTGDVQSVRSFVDGVLLQGGIMVLVALRVRRVHAAHAPAAHRRVPLAHAAALARHQRLRPLGAPRLRQEQEALGSDGARDVRRDLGHAGRSRSSDEDHELRRFRERNREVRDQQRSIFVQVSRFSPTIDFVSQMNIAVLLLHGGYLVIRGSMSLGELIVFAGLLAAVGGAGLEHGRHHQHRCSRALIGAERVFEVLDAPLDVRAPKRRSSLDEIAEVTCASRTSSSRTHRRRPGLARRRLRGRSRAVSWRWSAVTGSGKSSLLG